MRIWHASPFVQGFVGVVVGAALVALVWQSITAGFTLYQDHRRLNDVVTWINAQIQAHQQAQQPAK